MFNCQAGKRWLCGPDLASGSWGRVDCQHKGTAKQYEAVRSVSFTEQVNVTVQTVKPFLNTLHSPTPEKSKGWFGKNTTVNFTQVFHSVRVFNTQPPRRRALCFHVCSTGKSSMYNYVPNMYRSTPNELRRLGLLFYSPSLSPQYLT